ncbi:sugar transferase [Stagnihabitans tardus]|uniref:Sugar transferase n=1 Tax=Stagnihabitans tardus TaxID=2699202 RepID=A0AAE4YE29_9RHOB|nr:sugar transferase [Stagnihabitans tardus]NBZ89666.1 sugar transferase [Stagnihabitans tardus]
MSFEPVEIVSETASGLVRPSEAESPAFGLYVGTFKRLIDMGLVLLAAPFVILVILPIALYIRRDGHSAFYWSERVGRHGRTFRMMKLRTMVPDADEKLAAYLDSDPEAAAEWRETQKLKADPRITAFGRFLRKSSLDELPQLWNVLKGEMSLVGPRPMMPNQRKMYPGRAYYALRPGVTGPWQVSDRNETTFARRADYDLDYCRRVSLAHDASLIWQTLSVVLRGTGY